jgi:hypothetical protein
LLSGSQQNILGPVISSGVRIALSLILFICWVVAWQEQSVANEPSHEVSSPGVRLENADEDFSRFQPIHGLRSYVVYRATENTGYYNHHPHVIRYRGMFFVAWSNHPIDEDAAGQRVLLSVSRNGQRWSLPVSLFPPLYTQDGKGLILTANGWLELDGCLYAIADVHDDIGWSDAEGLFVSSKQTASYHRAAQRAIGRLGRKVNGKGSMGKPFWVAQHDPASRACKNCRVHPALSAKMDAALRQPLNRRTWDLAEANRHGFWIDRYPVKAADGHRLTEPTTYRRPDGVLVRLLRDLDGSNFIYASLSSDGSKTWSTPQRTTLPDSPSRSFTGSLPDGQVFLIGNPVQRRRDPLVIRLSRDGLVFRKAMVVRRNSPAMRRNGRYKGPGFQYPSAVVTKDSLWIVYSVNKEDIEISRVPHPGTIYADK